MRNAWVIVLQPQEQTMYLYSRIMFCAAVHSDVCILVGAYVAFFTHWDNSQHGSLPVPRSHVKGVVSSLFGRVLANHLFLQHVSLSKMTAIYR